MVRNTERNMKDFFGILIARFRERFFWVFAIENLCLALILITFPNLVAGVLKPEAALAVLVIEVSGALISAYVSIYPIEYTGRLLKRKPLSVDDLPPAKVKLISVPEVSDSAWRGDVSTVRYIERLKQSLRFVEDKAARRHQYEVLMRYYEIDEQDLNDRCRRKQLSNDEAADMFMDSRMARKAFEIVDEPWRNAPAQAAALVRQLDRLYAGDARKEIRDIEDAIRVLGRQRSTAHSFWWPGIDDEIHSLQRDITEVREFAAEQKPRTTAVGELYEKEFLPRIQYEEQARVDQAETRLRAEMDRIALRGKLRGEVERRFKSRADRKEMFRRIDKDLGFGDDDIFDDDVEPRR